MFFICKVKLSKIKRIVCDYSHCCSFRSIQMIRNYEVARSKLTGAFITCELTKNSFHCNRDRDNGIMEVKNQKQQQQ